MEFSKENNIDMSVFENPPFSQWLLYRCDYDENGKIPRVLFLNEKTNEIKEIMNENGHFVNFPGVIEEDHWMNYYDGKKVGNSLAYGVKISECYGGGYQVEWCIQPDGFYWADADGFGAENVREINLYAYIDQNGDFTGPFKALPPKKDCNIYEITAEEKFFCRDRLFDCNEKIEKIIVSKDNPFFCSIDGVLFSKDKTELLAYPHKSKATHYDIPKGVIRINNGAFKNCRLLKSVNIPEGVKYIGSDAFSKCESLESVNIPKGTTEIGEGAFLFCYSLKSIYISEDVKSIEKAGIDSCQSLKSITVIDKNQYYCSIDGVLFSKDKSRLIIYPRKKENESYEIPDGVKEIGIAAFEGCKSLTDITIPQSVTKIESEAFRCCKSLKSIIIPDSVESIEEDTFWDCENLESIVIPDGVEEIGDYAFSKCKSLKSIVIPDRVKEIGIAAFSSCESLTDITIPQSVTKIEREVFRYCKSLKNIIIPNSVESIGEDAFLSCENLESIIIPDGVMEIGIAAFSSCESMTDIIVSADNQYYCSVDGVLFNKDKTMLVNYPAGKTIRSYNIPNGVTQIGIAAFKGCKSLTDITIPQSVAKIKRAAFSYCKSLRSIIFPNSMESIGEDAFWGCENLKSATVPSNVNIGIDAFDKGVTVQRT